MNRKQFAFAESVFDVSADGVLFAPIPPCGTTTVSQHWGLYLMAYSHLRVFFSQREKQDLVDLRFFSRELAHTKGKN